MATASVNGFEMSFRDVGHGPPLLLLHGLGGSNEVWRPVVDRFSTSRRLVIPDHRGHGASSAPPGDYSIGLFAEDLLALMIHLGLPHADVIGLSMGGSIAMSAAVRAPERIRRLVAVDSWGYSTPEFVALLNHRRRMLDERDVGRYADITLSQLFTPGFIERNPDVVGEYRARTVSAVRPESLLKAFEACARFDLRADLPKIRIPTLVIVGREDRLLPPTNSEYLQRTIPGARLAILEGSGHMPHWERTEEFCALVEKFLG